MAYLRCTACGSKALVAASQCPRCWHPFQLVNARGDRAKLARCRGCGIMHRADSLCHWCGEIKTPAWRSAAVWRPLSGLAAAAVLAVGGWQLGPGALSAVRSSAASLRASTAPVATVAEGSAGTPSVAAPRPEPRDNGLITSAMAATVTQADSIEWTPAVARTWVNVRSDASRDGEVVGVIQPDARALLGSDRAGWRQVRSTEVTGWVDPRLFDADSLRPRGD